MMDVVRSQLGKSATISTGGMPSAIILTTVETGMRVPRIQGTPAMIFWFALIRSNAVAEEYRCQRHVSRPRWIWSLEPAQGLVGGWPAADVRHEIAQDVAADDGVGDEGA